MSEAQEVAAEPGAVGEEVGREGEATRQKSAVSSFSGVHIYRGIRVWMGCGIVTGRRRGWNSERDAGNGFACERCRNARCSGEYESSRICMVCV